MAYQVYALKYGERETKESQFFFREASQKLLTLHFFIWVILGGPRSPFTLPRQRHPHPALSLSEGEGFILIPRPRRGRGLGEGEARMRYARS
jgi:hypothetical protein